MLYSNPGAWWVSIYAKNVIHTHQPLPFCSVLKTFIGKTVQLYAAGNNPAAYSHFFPSFFFLVYPNKF